LADFALVDQDGQPFSLANLRGRWTFLAIGYTHCPDVCPTTLATFAAVQGRIAALSSKGEAVAPSQFLFISVDPERDSPERLAHYVRYFDPAFLGATGDDAQLRVLVAQLGLLYAKVEDQDTAMGYLVDHSAWILLVDPEGRLTAIYMPPHDPERIAADFFSIEAATLPEKPPGSPPPSPIMSSPIPPQ
jgi:protein SCO1/2